MTVVILRSRNGNRNQRVNKHSKDYYKNVKPPSFSSSKFTKANLHGIIAELISKISLSEKNEVDAPEHETDSESKLLVKSTSANTINTGDIHQPIHRPGKNKSISDKKKSFQ